MGGTIMVIRAAAASTDGENIDVHFGKADKFYIAECDDETGEIKVVEERGVTRVCAGTGHNDERVIAVAEALGDCDCVLAQMIGPGAAQELEKRGMTLFEMSGAIKEAAEKMVKYIKVQRLFSMN